MRLSLREIREFVRAAIRESISVPREISIHDLMNMFPDAYKRLGEYLEDHFEEDEEFEEPVFSPSYDDQKPRYEGDWWKKWKFAIVASHSGSVDKLIAELDRSEDFDPIQLNWSPEDDQWYESWAVYPWPQT